MIIDMSEYNKPFNCEDGCKELLLGEFKTNLPYILKFTPTHDYRVDGYKWRSGPREKIPGSDISVAYH